MKWYKHDSDAHRDAKLKKLILKYGMQGYGLYWYCIELIVNDVDENNITFQLEYDSELISHDVGISHELVQEMMTYMVNLSLFENNDGVITCFKIAKRLDKSMTSNPAIRALIDRVREHHDSVMTQSGDSMQDKTRLDKTRVDIEPPTINQVIKYFNEKGYTTESAKRAFNHYETLNWHNAHGKPVKNWKNTMGNNWFKDENEIKPEHNPAKGAI